jgi:hypothetical protein
MKTLKIENKPKIKTGYKTPENYFENFSSKILLQINQEKEAKIIPLYAKKHVWIYAVAAVFLVGLMIPLYNYLENPLSKIDEKTLENYLVYSSQITEDEYTYLLNDEDIKKIDIGLNVENNTIENELINNTNLEHYLFN